nr:hypothetical protein [Escherichia coli]
MLTEIQTDTSKEKRLHNGFTLVTMICGLWDDLRGPWGLKPHDIVDEFLHLFLTFDEAIAIFVSITNTIVSFLERHHSAHSVQGLHHFMLGEGAISINVMLL